MSEWSQPYAHLDPGAPAGNKLILQFREIAQINKLLSADGLSVYDRLLQVQVAAIGQRQSQPIYTLVKITEGKEKIDAPNEYRRFRDVFEAWRKNQAPSSDGIPLEQWPLMTSDVVRAFKDANVHTIEDLANAADSVGNNIRAEFFTWRAKAQSWLKEAKEKGGDAKARAENAKLRKELDDLKAQMAQLLANQNGAPGFDAPKRKRNGKGDDLPPVSIPDEAMEEFEDDRL